MSVEPFPWRRRVCIVSFFFADPGSKSRRGSMNSHVNITIRGLQSQIPEFIPTVWSCSCVITTAICSRSCEGLKEAWKTLILKLWRHFLSSKKHQSASTTSCLWKSSSTVMPTTSCWSQQTLNGSSCICIYLSLSNLWDDLKHANVTNEPSLSETSSWFIVSTFCALEGWAEMLCLKSFGSIGLRSYRKFCSKMAAGVHTCFRGLKQPDVCGRVSAHVTACDWDGVNTAVQRQRRPPARPSCRVIDASRAAFKRLQGSNKEKLLCSIKLLWTTVTITQINIWINMEGFTGIPDLTTLNINIWSL